MRDLATKRRKSLVTVLQACLLLLQVVVQTTKGDIDIELWAKEAPKVHIACLQRHSYGGEEVQVFSQSFWRSVGCEKLCAAVS